MKSGYFSRSYGNYLPSEPRITNPCAKCGEQVNEDDGAEVDGVAYCPECRDADFLECQDCEEWFARDSTFIRTTCDGDFCEDCLDQRIADNGQFGVGA